MKKILIVSTVSRQFYLFEQGNIEVLKSLGYEVHCAANYEDANERLNVLDIVRHPFEIQRSPFSLKNVKAYKQLKKIMKSENFDAVHCHSPMGGVLGRLAAKRCKVSCIIYTAHGFHFYKSAPLINWIFYYPIERLLSLITDILITINKEDYKLAQKFNSSKTLYVPGIGIDINKFCSSIVSKESKRKELGISLDKFIILSVGELNKNKNHEIVIRAIAEIYNSNIIYIICGKGEREDYLNNLAFDLGISDKVKLLGYRNDIAEIYKVADLFAFPSYREGLSVSLMEAMAAGLPIICSSIRGNSDLITDSEGGYLINPNDRNAFIKKLRELIENPKLREKMRNNNIVNVRKYDKLKIKNMMSEIYERI